MVERSASVMFLINTLLISLNCTLLAHENVTTDLFSGQFSCAVFFLLLLFLFLFVFPFLLLNLGDCYSRHLRRKMCKSRFDSVYTYTCTLLGFYLTSMP